MLKWKMISSDDHHVLYPGGLPYERGRDDRQKILIKPLKETNLGVFSSIVLGPDGY